MNNKTLAIIFAALVALYALSKLLGGNRDRSFDPVVVAVDTSVVEKVILHPANDGEPFTLQKSGKTWTLVLGGNEYIATNTSVNSLLANLIEVKAERIVSKSPEKQSEYGVDQATGTEIEVYDAKSKIHHIVVGRFSFNQATRSGISYIKHMEGDAVYAVDGFLSMSLTQNSDNYRDKTLTNLNSDDLTTLTLSTAEDRYQYSKSMTGWTDEQGQEVDSTKIESYLTNLKAASGSTFAELNNHRGPTVMQLQIEGNNMEGPIALECFTSRDTSHHFVVHSSLNPQADFFSDSTGIFNRIFQGFFTARQSE